MIEYNLKSLFRMFVLHEKMQKTISILRYRTSAIGAYFEKVNGKLVLKIALNKKYDEHCFLVRGTIRGYSISLSICLMHNQGFPIFLLKISRINIALS